MLSSLPGPSPRWAVPLFPRVRAVLPLLAALAAPMALAAAVYMALMGRQGMRQVATLTYQNTHYAAKSIGALPGYQVVDNGAFFREFVVKCPRPVAHINRRLAEVGIIGGYDLGQDYPHLADHMLIAATEMTPKADIDHPVSQLNALA